MSVSKQNVFHKEEQKEKDKKYGVDEYSDQYFIPVALEREKAKADIY